MQIVSAFSLNPTRLFVLP